MGCVESSTEPPKQQTRASVKQPVRNGSNQRRQQQNTGAPQHGSRVQNGSAVPKKVTMDIGIQTEGGGFILRRLSSRIKQKRSTREQRVADPPVDEALLFDMHRTVALNHSHVSLYIEQALTLQEKPGGLVRRGSSRSRKVTPGKVVATKSSRDEGNSVDAGPLSKKDIRLVQDCWKHVQRDLASFGVRLFVRLLDKNPSIAKLFPFGKLNLTPKQLQNNPDLKAHGLRVMETIGTAVEGLQDLELIVAILMDLGERHSMYGAKPEHFSALSEAFMYSLRNGLAPNVFNSEVHGAFGNTLTVIEETMSSKMGTDGEGPLSKKDIRLVQDCWKHVNKNLASFGVGLFVRLLDKNPSIAKLFPFGKLNLTSKQLQNNPDLKAHGLRVMETIGTTVEGLQDLELIVAILMDLGERHSMYGAKPEHFSALSEAFMYSLRNGLAPNVFNSEVQGAFGHTLTVIQETMSSKMGKSVDEGPLSKKDIRLVQDCWKHVQTNLASFGVRLFVRLLDKNPSIAKLFPFGKLNLTPKQLQNNPDLKAHGLRVMETIGTAVEGLQDLEPIVAILMDLGDRHSMYGAKPEHFSALSEAFMYSLRNGLAPNVFNSEVQVAFGHTLTVIQETMSSKMGNDFDKIEPNEKDLNANEDGPISTRDKKLVQGCWKIVQKDLINIGAVFFVRLLDQNQSIRTLFPFGKSPLPPQMLKRNPDLRAHGQNVMETIGAAVSGLDELGVVVTILEELGSRHRMYGAKPEHFKPVVEALIFALTTSLPKDVFTSEVKEAWLSVLKVVSSLMANQLE
ncbi:uncharacterized protein LOC117298827 isoform X1 [Asterias rubens]|uniref:uncharacterized protein LOC117298827 isoform X1 n=1 Tax=Asterias rubens TaxID=7604 RepID=UPI0014559AC8|nr:uncharacterized protein LOC117298827 isoform X1 [Asterias rubens]XP_033638067.1 uncharacterized protein LOC117298827 isoform X1 [Asterias rubens]